MVDETKSIAALYGNNPTFAGIDPALLQGMDYDPVASYSPPISAPVTTRDVDGMKDILQKLSNVGALTVGSIKDRAYSDPFLAEAITTRKTPSSISIGERYTIQIIDEDAKKRFNVVDTNGTVLAADLYLYESAYAMVKLLNRGVPALDPRIRKIVVLEERYYANRSDALRFKQRHAKAKQLHETRNVDIYAAKYQRARENALEAKNEVKQLLESL